MQEWARPSRDPPVQARGASQWAQSPTASLQRWLTMAVTALSPPPHLPPSHPRAPHRLRSSVSSRSLAWLADSRFCKNALTSFQAA